MNTLATAELARPTRDSTSTSGVLQRKCGCPVRTIAQGGECENCRLQSKGRHGTPSPARGALAVPASVREVIAAAGRPLEDDVRETMERGFGHDFRNVRVHHDGKAARSAAAVAANAYTVGNHVAFGHGRYAPHKAQGLRLLAHELAHVVQQREMHAPIASALRIGAAGDAHEAAADGAAEAMSRGAPVAGVGHAPQAMLQRDPTTPGSLFLTPSLIPLDKTLGSAEIEEGEAIGKNNPKLREIAQAYQANAAGGARIHVSSYLPSSLQYDTVRQNARRGTLTARMRAIRDALQTLGVPADAIDLAPATGFSTSAHGQVSVEVSQPSAPGPLLAPPLPGPGRTLPPVPPAQQGGSGLPSLNLDFKFGPISISLPKEVRARLPLALAHGRSLVIELSYEVPAKFSFKMTLDGTPYVRVSLKAGAEIDTKSGAATASAGLVIETTETTCNAPDPGETRDKIKKAGDKLNKAAAEFAAASGSDKLGKAFDIAGAIGEMYDAVDKAKGKCKQVPRATFEFGYKRPLSPGDETDPLKRPSEYVGATATFHF